MIRRGAGALLIAAMLVMLVSVGWWVAVAREGLLEGDGLFTVRRPADLEVVHLTPNSHVEEGAVLARFHSPDAESQIAVLKLRRESLATEQEAILHQVLAIDPEIAQKLADANANERTLRTNLSDLTLEKERLDRESLREQLGRREEIRRRELEIRKLEAEADQARTALQVCRDDHARSATLRERKAVTEQQHAEKEAELEALQIEVRKLQDQLQQTREQKAELEQGLERVQRLSEQQTSDLRASIAAVEDRFAQVTGAQGELHRRHDEDLRRARRHREESLKKLAIEAAQTERQLAAQQERLEKRAPFAGHLAYRAAAPGNADSGEPLVVLTPPDGLRLSVRLPRWMKSPLERAGDLSWKLLEDLERDEQRRFVESRFTTRLHRWKELAAHPGHGLAEFTCEPPAEAVRLLARGDQIAARLVWRPPLYSMPAFTLSLLVAGVAGMAWATMAISTKPEPSGSQPTGPSSMNGHGMSREVSTEFGAEGELLRLLGTQLREMTARGELDANIIAAAEWALARHRDRAVRLLSEGLGDGLDLCNHLRMLVKSVVEEETASNGRANAGRAVALRRLVAVLRAAAPAGSSERIRRIGRRLSRPANRGANGHRHHFELAGQDRKSHSNRNMPQR